MQCDVGMVFLGRRERISMEEVGATSLVPNLLMVSATTTLGPWYDLPVPQNLGCHVPLPPSKQWDVKPFQTEGSVGNSIFGGDHWLISPKRDVSGNAGNDVIPASSSFIQLHVSKKIGQRSNTSVLLKLKHDPHAREMSVGKMMWVRREAMGGSSVVKQFRRSCGACCNQD